MRYIVAVLLLAAMGLVTQLTGDHSVVYPPMAALVLGVVMKDRLPWTVRLWQLTPILTVASAVGVVVSNYLHAGIIVDFTLGYFVIALVLTLFRSTLFPAVATCLLPIVLHIRSPRYVVSVFVCSLAVSLIGKYWMSKGMNSYPPHAEKGWDRWYKEVWHWTYLWLYFVVLLIVAALTHKMTLVAPPLIVIYITLSHNRTYLPGNSLRILIAIFLASCCGVVGKLALQASVPMTVVLPATFLLAYAVMKKIRVVMPPIAAISILPFVLPGRVWLYPVLATIGSIYLIVCVNIRRNITWRIKN